MLVGLGLLWIGAAASAQEAVYFDATFGNPGPAPTAPYVPPGGPTGVDYRIDSTRGQVNGNTQLFHSFSRFDIPAGDAATFLGPDSIDFIFARVTGEAMSEIDGLLRSEVGDADLFVLNPYGVVFGADAELNVPGSFYVSTADELRFDNGAEVFEARLGGAVPVEVAAPISFGFLIGGDPPAKIAFEGTLGLTAAPGETLSAVAGRVEVAGRLGFPSPTLGDTSEPTGGLIQLAAVPAGTDVPLAVADLDVAGLGSDEATVHLTSNAIVGVRGSGPDGPGRIVIRGGRFETVRPQGFATSATLSAEATGVGDSPAIDVEVAGTVSLDAGTIESVATAGGASGDIRLAAGDRVELDDGTLVEGRMAAALSDLDGPGIRVEAEAGTVAITNGSKLRTRDDIADNEFGINSGKVGDIAVIADEVELSGQGSNISAVAKGRGKGATVRVEAATRVALSNGAGIFTSRLQSLIPSEPPEGFDFGEIQVVAAEPGVTELSVTDAAEIRSATSSDDFDGAAVRVGTADAPLGKVEVIGGAIGSVTTAAAAGGAVEVYAQEIAVQSSAAVPEANPQISALTTRNSSGGGGDGPGGDLTIYAGSMDLIDGGQLRATTEGSAPSASGGNLEVHVEGTLLAQGRITLPDGEGRPSGIFTRSALFPGQPGVPTTGPGGQLDITAKDVVMKAGAEFSAAAQSEGSAGGLHLVAETVLVEGAPEVGAFSTISTKGAAGPGGNLEIETDVLQVYNGGFVTASANGTARSGDVGITARDIDIAGEDTGVFAKSNPQFSGAGRAGSVDLSPPDGERLTLRVRDGALLSVQSVFSAAGEIQISGAELVEVSNGGQISALVEHVGLEPGEVPEDLPGLASDIRITDTDTVNVWDGTITAETRGSGFGGSITIEATNVDVSGAEISARSIGTLSNSGDAGSIAVRAAEALDVQQSEITTEAFQASGGTITLEGGESANIADLSKISALARGEGAAGDIFVQDTGMFSLTSGSTMTAETNGTGGGGTITFQNVGDVFLSGDSSITTRSTAEGGGDAGDIVIAALRTFQATDSAVTTTAEDAGGGRISIQAGNLVYLLDSRLETTVNGEQVGEDAGDIDIPLRGDEGDGLNPVVPEFVVINRSIIKANATATDAGDITIAGDEVLISSDSLIEAHSDLGVSGEIQISSPDADVVSQVTPLPSSFVDPSDRLLPPCAARTERTGSFVVQSREAIQPLPDAPLSPALAGAAGAAGASPTMDSENCPVSEERS